jgi:hypothetical protein
MDMIRGDMPLQDIHTQLLTFLPDNGAHPFRHFTTQHLVAVLDDLDNVEVNRKGCMGTMTIVTHAPQSTENLLKLPPKGGGFAPRRARDGCTRLRHLLAERPRVGAAPWVFTPTYAEIDSLLRQTAPASADLSGRLFAEPFAARYLRHQPTP